MITLRAAIPEDAPMLRIWDRQPHVIASGIDEDWRWEIELPRHPDWREQLIAEHDGRAIGFIEIIDPAREETHYWGDVEQNLRAMDIWIGMEADLNKGFGTQMIQLALARCFAPPAVKAVLIDPLSSNTAAHRFYRRQGFRFVEERWFDDDHCHVHRLSREDWLLQRRSDVE